ncbi:MAG: hypothetical protein J0L54_00075 [Chitinophagales bacterium]|nr:hypothetical protein [Chitinophagales bacterium]
MPKPSKPSKSKVIDEIAKHAARRGVFIVLDGDNKSKAALADKKYLFEPDGKILTIVLDSLNAEESEAVSEIALEYFEKHGLILDAEQEAALENYQSYDSFNPYTEILNLFQGKIPKNDLNALKMSLYMLVQSEEGVNVDEIKKQIKDRFGSRGVYISNLCKAGYYEGIFRDQCLKLSPDKFTEYYELRVGEELAALFVHTGLTINSMAIAFIEKVQGCLRNDIGKFRVLGFGRKNKDLIEEFKRRIEEFDIETELKWKLILKSPPPHVGIEYDILLP